MPQLLRNICIHTNIFISNITLCLRCQLNDLMRSVLLAASLCCALLLTGHDIGLPLQLISGFSSIIATASLAVYFLEVLLTRRCLINDLFGLWQQIRYVLQGQDSLWAFCYRCCVIFPQQRLAFIFELLCFNQLLAPIPHTPQSLASKTISMILFYTFCGLTSESMAAISWTVLQQFLATQSLLWLSAQLMAIAIRPDFWNRGLESFAYRDSLTSKCSFILWHFLFPLSNLLLAVRTIPELPAFQAQQRFVPQPVALPDFPGAAQPLNPAAAPRNPHFEELRRLRNNHLGHHNV